MLTPITRNQEALTPEQEALADAIVREYVDDLTVYREPDMATIQDWLVVVYGLFDLPVPKHIEVVPSPYAACALAEELTGQKQASLDNVGTGEGGWVSFYDFFERCGVLSAEENANVRKLRDFGRVASDSLLLDECAIVVARPTALKLDDAGNLHSATGPCIQWSDGEKDFAWHGTWVPERMIIDPHSYSREEYLDIENTEERRALSEIAGWDWVVSLLGAAVVDAWVDPNTGLKYELSRCSNSGPTLLRKQSPPLKDGSQPWYSEPVHERLRTAQAARKWQATAMRPEECELNPELYYSVET
jgi:hypothetical protein